MVFEFEDPVDRDPVAFDHRGDADRDDAPGAREGGALMGHQQVTADPRWGGTVTGNLSESFEQLQFLLETLRCN